jgi:hypothetical protein
MELTVIKNKGTMGMGRHRCEWSWKQQAADGEEVVRESPGFPSLLTASGRYQNPAHVCVRGWSKERCPKSCTSPPPQSALLSISLDLPGDFPQPDNHNLDMAAPILRWFLWWENGPRSCLFMAFHVR